MDIDLELIYNLSLFNYYFYIKKLPFLNRIDIKPYIEKTGYNIITTDYLWDDYIFMVMNESKTTVVLGICSSFIRNMEWWGMGGNFDIAPIIKYKDLNIHNGFFETTTELLKHPMLDILKAFDSDGKKIILTGHSRGASIVSILSIRLLYEHNIKTTVYTFGEAASLYKTDTRIPHIDKYRFVTKSDLITSFGLSITRHWGKTYLLQDDSCIQINDYNYPSQSQYNIYNHLPSNYLNTIANLLHYNKFVGISSLGYLSFYYLKRIVLLAEKLIILYNFLTIDNDVALIT